MAERDYTSRIKLLQERRPDVIALAKLASLARRIEPEMLRTLRLRFSARVASEVPLTVGSESGLWFSALIESRGPDGITIIPSIAHKLREQLRNDDRKLFEEARNVISECHASIPPVIQWEEKLLYLGSSPELSESERNNELVRELLRAGITIRTGEHDHLRDWIAAAEHRLPDSLKTRLRNVVFAKRQSGISAREIEPLPSGVKLLSTLTGHRGTVNSVAFDPEGGTLASGSADKAVNFWEARSGKLLRTLEGHQGQVWSVAFNPQGVLLASGSADKTVKIWEASSGKLLRTLEGHQKGVLSVAFDPQGITLASGSEDNTVTLWEARSGKLLRTLDGHQGSVRSVAFDPQGLLLASGSADKTVKIWEVNSGKMLRFLEGHQGRVNSVTFDPQGRAIVSGSADKTVKFWEALSGKLLRTLEGHTKSVNVVAFSPDGGLLASKGGEGTIRVWSCETWVTVSAIPEPITDAWNPALAFDPALPVLVTSGSGPGTPKDQRCRLLHLWELDYDMLLGQHTIGETAAQVVPEVNSSWAEEGKARDFFPHMSIKESPKGRGFSKGSPPHEIQSLLAKIKEPKTDPTSRLDIGDRLAELGDPRRGIGLDGNGLPDIDWVEIPSGPFIYQDRERRKLPTFWISRYPITNRQFQSFIDDGGYLDKRWWVDLIKPKPGASRWPHSNRPRTNVAWDEAVAYTRWLAALLGLPEGTLRLPTEDEWEKAARGEQGLIYPWGNDYRSGFANVDETVNRDGPWFLKQTTAVGLYPQGRSTYEVEDLAGTVWEWCLNQFDHPAVTAADASATRRATRGGSWIHRSDYARTVLRGRFLPLDQLHDVGFRVLSKGISESVETYRPIGGMGMTGAFETILTAKPLQPERIWPREIGHPLK